MNFEIPFSMWAEIGRPFANHLWQSSGVVGVAWLLSRLLRNNRAAIRSWVWFLALLKFLVPFSILVRLGGWLAPVHPKVVIEPIFLARVDEVTEPFHQQVYATHSLWSGPSRDSRVLSLLPLLAGAVWLCGALVIGISWYVRWRGLARVARMSACLESGREWGLLRDVERTANLSRPLRLIASEPRLEPGVFGILHPVVVWPLGISERLSDAQIRAILCHEVCHVKRRDNLVAILVMVVKAFFWYCPFVWWLSLRLTEERERACDEWALDLGNRPSVYAESILVTCMFCVSDPVPCMASMAGADLRERITRIMIQSQTRKLGVLRRGILGVVAIGLLSVPFIFGVVYSRSVWSQTQEDASLPKLNFAVASIRAVQETDIHYTSTRVVSHPGDGQFYASGITLRALLRYAYGVEDPQIAGGPSWLNSERFNIEAKSDSSVDHQLQQLSPDEARIVKRHMLQKLLRERFNLTLGLQVKTMPVYALVIARGVTKLQAAKEQSDPSNTGAPVSINRSHMQRTRGALSGQRASMNALAQALSQEVGRTVLDKTGLSGTYDFTLQWTPEEASASAAQEGNPAESDPGSNGPTLFTAIQEQLGLKLEARRGPVDVFAINHVEHPSEN